MEKILKYLAQETDGQSYKSHKYCYENVHVPSITYDDNKNITFKKYGETEPIKRTKSLEKKALEIRNYKPLFRYFLDGSRRTYKVDDISYDSRIYPVVAGQVSVACCERLNPSSFKSCIAERHYYLTVPEVANKDRKKDLFYNNLLLKINNLEILTRRGIQFSKIIAYEDKIDNDNYENKGIAKIQDEMIDLEKKVVSQLTIKNLLSQEAYLIKDGSLEYKVMKTGDFKDLSKIKNNYRCVVGVSKSFNPEKCMDESKKSNASKIAQLKFFERTPAYMYQSEMSSGVRFCIWYLRIRDPKYTVSPFDGIVKIEKILISDHEQENGLDSEEVDLISANIINERNPVCYGKDDRWANHLYPIYLTETFIKSRYLSDNNFINIF